MVIETLDNLHRSKVVLKSVARDFVVRFCDASNIQSQSTPVHCSK